MSRRLQTVFVAVVATLVMSAAAANASAADVTVVSRDGKSKTFTISQLASQFDVNQDYKVTSGSGSSRTVPVNGVSVRKLLELADADPAYSKIVIAVPGASSVRLTRTQIENSDFAPPTIYEDGGQVAFIRPSYAAGDANQSSLIKGPSISVNQPEIKLDDGPIVTATASTKKGKVKKSITFTAKITNTAAGEQFVYKWNFDDGTTATGATVKHAWKRAGTMRVIVTATPVGETTSSPGTVTVVIGKPIKSDKKRAGNGTNDDAAAPATGSSTGDSGSGDQAARSGAAQTAKKKRPKKTQSPSSGLEVVRGELVAATSAPIDPAESSLAARSGQQKPADSKGFTLSDEAWAGILALMLLAGGALLELRGTPHFLRRRPAGT